jgi:hypothetical protein
MNNQPLLSLCIPTYGVSDWVFPCLETIYGLAYPDTTTTYKVSQTDEQKLNSKVDESLYEVVITDNGNNQDFEKKIKEYQAKHLNIVYKETTASGFVNEAESYKEANGLFIKFINHRNLLKPGALEYLIDFVKYYSVRPAEERPFMYFMNGAYKLPKTINCYKTFNDFVRNLSIFSSWSTGMGFWKEDFADLFSGKESSASIPMVGPSRASVIDSDTNNDKDNNGTVENHVIKVIFNELFPHTTILFSQRHKKSYIIDNTVLLAEQQQGKKPKGSYDLYYAFGVEYMALLTDLLRTGDITVDTFSAVKKENLAFIRNLYFDYHVRHSYCSYDLSGFDKAMEVFYSKKQVTHSVLRLFIVKSIHVLARPLVKLIRHGSSEPLIIKQKYTETLNDEKE